MGKTRNGWATHPHDPISPNKNWTFMLWADRAWLYIYNGWWLVKSYVILRDIYQNRGCFQKKSLVAGYNRENNVPTTPYCSDKIAITAKAISGPEALPAPPRGIVAV